MSQGITVVSVAQLNAMATQVQGISKRITELETALSVQLFDRHPKGIRPTASAHATERRNTALFN